MVAFKPGVEERSSDRRHRFLTEYDLDYVASPSSANEAVIQVSSPA